MEVVNNKYVSTAITIGLGLYAALLGPNLPTFVKDLFKNTLFRILVLFLVVVRGNKDPKMAIMIAIAFVLTLDYVYVRDAKEAFESMENGLEEGMEDSVEEGMEDSVEEGMEDSVEEGMEDGLEEGMEDGLEEGMEDGLEEGMEDGLEEGMEDGLEEGMEDGLVEGMGRSRSRRRRRRRGYGW
jgi:hypothetical protein